MERNTDIPKVSQQKTTMNIPTSLHRQVRIMAIEQGVLAQDIWVKAMREYIERQENPKSQSSRVA